MEVPMSQEPQIQQRAAQPYAGIRVRVTMDGISAAVDEAFPELFGWLAEHEIAPTGPPFIRFHVIDMMHDLDIELAVPAEVTDEMTAGQTGRVRAGTMPGGRYAVLRHVGPYDGLVASNAALQEWAEQHGVQFDSWDTDRGSAWRGRAEHYLTNPAEEPDASKWEVDVAYLTKAT
jgi:effector-binding domain-containing protein